MVASAPPPPTAGGADDGAASRQRPLRSPTRMDRIFHRFVLNLGQP